MLTQFDPDKGPLFTGEFTSISLIDPAIPGHRGNLVFDPTKPFEIQLAWKLEGSDVPLYLAGADPTWSVEAFAESIGPGPEVRLAIGTLAKGPSVTPASYSHTLTVPANTLPEGNPFPGQPSGVYKIVCTVFLNSSVSGGFDVSGFVEGPVIRMEDPN